MGMLIFFYIIMFTFVPMQAKYAYNPLVLTTHVMKSPSIRFEIPVPEEGEYDIRRISPVFSGCSVLEIFDWLCVMGCLF